MKTIFTALTFAAALVAQTPNTSLYITQGAVNCRWFTTASDDLQLIYVTAVKEAFAMAENSLATTEATNGEAQAGMKPICAAPENASIRAIDAYTLFAGKVKGMPDADIKDWAAAARYYATTGTWPKAPEEKTTKKESAKGKL